MELSYLYGDVSTTRWEKLKCGSTPVSNFLALLALAYPATLAWKEWCLSISPKVGKSLTFREAVKLHLGELQSKLVVEIGRAHV